MSRRRVALFASEYPPYVYGGLGTHVHALTSALAARGARIELFVPRREGYEPPPAGIELHPVPVVGAESDAEFWIRYCEAAASVALELAAVVDLVHCHDWMTVVAGIRLQSLHGVPLVFNVHLPQTTGPNLAMENLGFVWADCVVANSRAVAQEVARRGLPIKSMRVVPNGVDLRSFAPGPGAGPDRYVLFVGRLVGQKGADVALRAFGVLLERVPDLRFVCAGEGDQALYLERLARHLGIPSRVSFVGWQRGDALVRLYRGAEAVVVPSRYEPFGIVALEAMACGRPVVAARTGGLAEVVEDGVTGFLVEPGDHLDFARRLSSILLDPACAERMGAEGRRRASRFGWERIAARTERLYDGVVGEGALPTLGEPSALADELIRSVEPPLQPLARRLVSGLDVPGLDHTL